ncbi:MAG: ATP-binding protein [Flavobacteriaceae bacterium]|nr:ATP-binding protein [Flavobacteriaceae bacterium]
MRPDQKVVVNYRRKADYFHGRKEEIDFFQTILSQSKEKKKSHTLLIQGAPGVGKSALLEELKKRGRNAGWRVAKLELEALSNIDELKNAL